VRRARGAIAGAAVLLLQLEVPVEASLEAARLAKQAGATVVLNPAPARAPSAGAPSAGAEPALIGAKGQAGPALPEALLRNVDVLAPNETEARQLTGLPVATADEAARAARALFQGGVHTVLVTLGERGALLADGAGADLIPSFPVRAVDTTAAGDAFCGALAVALAEGRPLRDAVRFACAAGALAVTVMGAGPSLPRRRDIERLLGGE
jgi:ribokinase